VPPLLIIFPRAWQAASFWGLRLVWVAGWLWNILQAVWAKQQRSKQPIFNMLLPKLGNQ
jgi:hypothetical protein